MKLTKLETEILRHRLAVPDAIIDAMTDTHPDDPPAPFSPDTVANEIDSIERRITAGHWDNLTDCEKAVLEDCIDGSTFGAVTADAGNDNIISQQKMHADFRSLDSLAAKVSKLIGKTVTARHH